MTFTLPGLIVLVVIAPIFVAHLHLVSGRRRWGWA